LDSPPQNVAIKDHTCEKAADFFTRSQEEEKERGGNKQTAGRSGRYGNGGNHPRIGSSTLHAARVT